MQYCMRSSTVPRGNSLTILQTDMKKTVLLPNPFDEILIAAFLEWSCYRRCGFDAKQKISQNLRKMFRSF